MSEILHTESLEKFIKSIELKEKTTVYSPLNHGSDRGDKVLITQYYNPLTYAWDTHENAILGHVIVACRPHIKEVITKTQKEK